MQNQNRGTRRLFKASNVKTVPVITNEGLTAQLPLNQIGTSGKTTTCHGKTFEGIQVNSAAYHTNGRSIVVGTNSKFDVAISMPQNDFQVLARTYLEGLGCKISAPSVSKS